MNEKVIARERIRKLLTFWHEAGVELKPLCKSEEIRKMYAELEKTVAWVMAKELKFLDRSGGEQ